MNTREEYKNHILKEYERLFNKSGKKSSESKTEEKPYFYFVMFSSEGLEMFKVVRDESEVTGQRIKNWELRCRFNPGRSLHLYAFKLDNLIDEKKINKTFLKKTGIIKLS